MKETTIESLEKKSPKLWRRILAPTDFSDLSKEAIKIAVCLAEQCRSKVILLHVVELSNAGVPIESGTAAYEVMESARKHLEQIASEIPATLASEKLVCLIGGEISKKIVEMARELSSDLIVLATHAHGLLKRALYGSTAESVNRHAHCEVLFVPAKPN